VTLQEPLFEKRDCKFAHSYLGDLEYEAPFFALARKQRNMPMPIVAAFGQPS
jgi:hypothetical protein